MIRENKKAVWGVVGSFTVVALIAATTMIDYNTQIKNKPLVSVGNLVANGTTDNTAAINAVLATGASILIPGMPVGGTCYKITTPLLLTAVGQSVYGVGPATKICQSGTEVNANVFFANHLGHNQFHDMYLVPGTTTHNLLYGYGVVSSSSDYNLVDNVEVSGHRRGAFIWVNSNYGQATNNFIHDSVVIDSAGTPDTASTSGNDIYGYGSTSYLLVKGNTIRHGSGFGIGFQTSSSGSDVNEHNSAIGNVIDGEGLYGIYTYLAGLTDSCKYHLVDGNQISNISGNIPNSVGEHAYGIGIYIQTCEHSTVSNNVVNNTGLFQPAVLTNGAGAIDSAGNTDVKIVNNRVSGALGVYQYFIVRAEVNDTVGCAQFSGNSTNTAVGSTAGAYMYDLPCLQATNNTFYSSGGGGTGILDIQVTHDQTVDHNISGNQIRGFGSGIVQTLAGGHILRSSTDSNQVSGNSSYAILNSGTQASVKNNIVNQVGGGVGIGLSAAVVTGQMTGNIIRGGNICIVNDAGPTFLLDANDTGNSSESGTCPNAYSSGNGEEFPLQASATPTVAGGARDFRVIDAATRTNFLHGTPGQEIQLRATTGFTVTNNAFILLAGSHNFVMANNDLLRLKFVTSSWIETARVITAAALSGTVGDATHVPQITVDATGRVSAVSPITINIGMTGSFTIRDAAGTGTCSIFVNNGGITSTTC